MAVFKCKMCGGSLEIQEGMTVCECEYCGSRQTIPATRDDVIGNLFNRANNLRMKSEFDKAQEIYEKIVAQNGNEAEAYWGIILCKYGIEYVEDPATLKKIPTCHRTQLESVFTDVDYIAAIEHSDTYQRSIYEEEARNIDTLQKNILEIVRKEKPFDVFICYKETDENGKRTSDSVIANDIYHQLSQEGIKTFYAAITLEDKLGQEYEPYIFAALTSAKVMLVVGTRPEYFTAVWVKNEWSRFIKLMKTDRSKLLIPCYRDMDAYDLPEEFSHLQAQDMAKIGFVNDIIRGIKKVTVKENAPAASVSTAPAAENVSVNSNATPLLKRAAIFLGDRDWDSTNEYCEKVLDIDPENAQAYLYKVLAKMRISSEDMMSIVCLDDFLDRSKYVDNDPDYKKAYKFGDDAIKTKLDDFRQSMIYNGAVRAMQSAKTDNEYRHAAKGFDIVANYKDSREKYAECEEKAKEYLYTVADRRMQKAKNYDEYLRAAEEFEKIADFRDSKSRSESIKEYLYTQACALFNKAKNVNDLDKVIEAFSKVCNYKDSSERIDECEQKAKEYLYARAVTYMNDADSIIKYENAEKMFCNQRLKGYKDSEALAIQCRENIKNQRMYDSAVSRADSATVIDQNEAAERFESISDFKDSAEKAKECRNKVAEYLARDKAAKRKSSIAKFIGIFGAVCAVFLVVLFTVILPSVRYNNALKMVENGQYDEAIAAFEALGDYKDSGEQITIAQNSKAYDSAVELMNAGKYEEAIAAFSNLGEFSDSHKKLKQAQIGKIKSGGFSVGDTIVFGDYSWIVLEKTDNSALLLAQDILFKKAYNDKYTDVTWEECTLRKYLNGDFYNMFSDEEKAMIQEVTNKNSDNAEYGTKGGNDTKDKIFLLSIDEEQTLSFDVRKASAWWWLRSPGLIQYRAAVVDSDGVIDTHGGDVNCEFGVRPALNLKF